MVDNKWFTDILDTLATKGAREIIALWAVMQGVQRNMEM
jgi:hypothetical protein